MKLDPKMAILETVLRKMKKVQCKSSKEIMDVPMLGKKYKPRCKQAFNKKPNGVKYPRRVDHISLAHHF